MSVEKWWNEISGRGKRKKLREKPTQTPFRPPRNPHGVTKMRTRDPSSGRRAPNRLCHEAAPQIYYYFQFLKTDRGFDGVRLFFKIIKKYELL